jgi:hypothetical protein
VTLHRHIHGPRIVALPTGDRSIEVLDFDFDPNSPPVDLDRSFERRIHTEPTIIRAGTVFCDNVVSALPYRKTIKREALHDHDFAGYMIDEERIVAVSVVSVSRFTLEQVRCIADPSRSPLVPPYRLRVTKGSAS